MVREELAGHHRDGGAEDSLSAGAGGRAGEDGELWPQGLDNQMVSRGVEEVVRWMLTQYLGVHGLVQALS